MVKIILFIYVGLKVCFFLFVCCLCLISFINFGFVFKFNFYLSWDWDFIDICLLFFNLFFRILDGWGYRMVYYLWFLFVYLYDIYILCVLYCWNENLLIMYMCIFFISI